jgi:hypothetical protein
MSIDLTKPVQTRLGKRVEIIKVLDIPLTDGDRIIGLVEYADGHELNSWAIDGTFYAKKGESSLDLENVVEF